MSAKVLRELVLETIDAMPASTAATRLRIAGLRSILIADSTTIRLHPALAQAFPGTWSNHSPAFGLYPGYSYGHDVT